MRLDEMLDSLPLVQTSPELEKILEADFRAILESAAEQSDLAGATLAPRLPTALRPKPGN
jgi:hypothetical protein